MARQTGITTDTTQRFVIDAGAVYINYGEEGERLLGATRDGNTFEIEQEIREIEIDGTRGPLKNARRVISSTARITANLIEVTADNVKMAIAGSSTVIEVETDEEVVTRDAEIGNDDYITNVALVGDIMGSEQGFVGMIKNALADGNFSVNLEDENEAVIEIQFTAHYDPAQLDEEPWEVRLPY